MPSAKKKGLKHSRSTSDLISSRGRRSQMLSRQRPGAAAATPDDDEEDDPSVAAIPILANAVDKGNGRGGVAALAGQIGQALGGGSGAGEGVTFNTTTDGDGNGGGFKYDRSKVGMFRRETKKMVRPKKKGGAPPPAPVRLLCV